LVMGGGNMTDSAASVIVRDRARRSRDPVAGHDTEY
jgi:hypothetical protein